MPNALFNDQVSNQQVVGGQPEMKAKTKSPVPAGELLNLPKEDRVKLGTLCKEAIDHWLESTSEHMEDLRRWNDLSEGVVEATDWPWPNASAAHIPLIETHMKSIHSVICRSMTTVSPLWFGRAESQETRELIPQIEDFLDDKAKSDLNTVEALSSVVWNASRDAIGWTKTYYAEEYEKAVSVVLVESVYDFTQQYKNAEAAGMTEEEYQEALAEIRQKAKPGEPYELTLEYDQLVYEGPKTDVIDEADWVQAPATAPDLRDCWAYGHGFYATRMDLKRRARNGEMWEKSVDKILKTTASKVDEWKQAKNRIEGITDKSSKRSGLYRIHELVVLCDLDRDGEEERYICQYSKERGMLLSAVKYYFDCQVHQSWRLLKKSGRRLGFSIPGELENTNTEIDDSVRTDINSAKIDSVPVFVAKSAAKKALDDAGFNDQFFKPAGVLYTPNGKEDISSFDVKGTDKRFSQSMRQEFVRYSEMLVGPTQMLSGRESPIDPDAPGNKTIALIQQSNMRIEDYINALRPSFDALGEIILSLYHQFGANSMTFRSREGGEYGAIKRIFLGYKIRLSTHGVRAMENPEVESKKALDIVGVLSKYPAVVQDPMRMRELFNRYLIAARVEGREDLIPSKEEVLGEQKKVEEAAMREKIMGELIEKGIIPPPMPPGAPAGALPPPGAPPAMAPGLPPPLAMPGAPPGAVGLPQVPNLPPPAAGMP